MLNISDNKTVGADRRLYSIIFDPSSMLEELYMGPTNLSCNPTIKLFTALSRILGIDNSDISDEACDAIIMAVKKNTSSVELHGDDPQPS